MLAEWSAECSDEDPVLVVPWKDPEGAAEFVDLRANPYDLDLIPEAEQHPPLMQALRALNAKRSPVFTAKCDAWALDAEELGGLRLNLGMEENGSGSAAGFASYIDLVWRERSVFTSFHRHELLLTRLTRNAARLDHPLAALEFVLRPALLDFEGAQQGYAASLYVKAVGDDAQAASEEWAAALAAVVTLVRAQPRSRTAGR